MNVVNLHMGFIVITHLEKVQCNISNINTTLKSYHQKRTKAHENTALWRTLKLDE